MVAAPPEAHILARDWDLACIRKIPRWLIDGCPTDAVVQSFPMWLICGCCDPMIDETGRGFLPYPHPARRTKMLRAYRCGLHEREEYLQWYVPSWAVCLRSEQSPQSRQSWPNVNDATDDDDWQWTAIDPRWNLTRAKCNVKKKDKNNQDARIGPVVQRELLCKDLLNVQDTISKLLSKEDCN
jgi:hypothetical protein